MQADVMHTFPLFIPIKSPRYTSLQLGSEGVIAFSIKALLDPQYISNQTFSSWQYFQFNVHTQKISHQGINFPQKYVHEMVMNYNKEKSSWMIGTYDPKVAIYELHDANAQPFVREEGDINDEIGSGGKRSILLESQRNICNFIFSVEDITEVDAPTIYWAHYDQVRKEVKLQQIARGDITVAYAKNNSYLFFQCQRLTTPTNVTFFPNEKKPIWSIAITAYTAEGSLIHKTFLPDISFPIHDLTFPGEDLFTCLDCRMIIANDTYQSDNDEEMCIAAITLEGTLGIKQADTTVKGGLFLVNLQGMVLKSLLVRLGTKISLCVSGNKVIGTDILNGVRRLWSWSPQENIYLEQHTSLSQDIKIKKTTLISMKSEEEKIAKFFWCIEEYATSIKVSQWDSISMKELTFLWYEGVTLLDTPNNQLSGIIAFQNKMYILGINEKKNLQILQFQ